MKQKNKLSKIKSFHENMNTDFWIKYIFFFENVQYFLLCQFYQEF